MSWFTVGEIVIWLALAALLGVVLGWLLHEIWNRARARRTGTEQTSAGQTSTGHTSTGETSAGESSASEVSTGESSTGEVSTGQSSAGESSTDLTAPAPLEPLFEPPAEARIKGKQKSKIYHVPGSPMYERTNADVWFSTEDQARGAGFRRPKNQ